MRKATEVYIAGLERIRGTLSCEGEERIKLMRAVIEYDRLILSLERLPSEAWNVTEARV